MIELCILSIAIAGAVPPLTTEQAARVQTADPSRDHQEEAFAALLENASLWSGDPAEVPARDQPDSSAVQTDPDAYRGDLFRIRGQLLQITRMKRPYETVYEWFVRLPSGRPVFVYVAELPDPDLFQAEQHVEVLGRFYKVMTMSDRQDRRQRYSAFVGALPVHVNTAPPRREVAYLWVVGLPVLAMLIVFVFLLGSVRKRRKADSAALLRRRVRAPDRDEADFADGGAPLPDDPADALAELRRRAEAGP